MVIPGGRTKAGQRVAVTAERRQVGKRADADGGAMARAWAGSDAQRRRWNQA